MFNILEIIKLGMEGIIFYAFIFFSNWEIEIN